MDGYAPPGWYEDPQWPGRRLYWTGGEWAAGPPPAGPGGSSTRWRLAAAVGGSLLGLALIGAIAGGSGARRSPPVDLRSEAVVTTTTDPPPSTVRTTITEVVATTEPRATSTRPAPTTTTLAPQTRALDGWVANHSSTLAAVTEAVSGASTSFTTESCNRTSAQATAALRGGAPPDPTSSVYWHVGLEHLRKYSSICLAYLRQEQGIDAAYALAELKLAGQSLHTAFEEIRSKTSDGGSLPTSPDADPSWPSIPSIPPTTSPPTLPPTTAAPDPEPPVVTAPPDGGGCNPNYTPCVPNASDVDCAGGSGNGPAYVSGPVTVTGTDVYDLDRDHDGIGCE